MGWLGLFRRCGRKQYWIMVGVLFAIAIAASIIHLDTSIGSFAWLTLYGARLHDFGRSRWWAAGVLALALFAVVAAAAFGGESFRYVLLHNGMDAAGHPSWTYFGVIGIAFLVQHSFTVWLGLQKGDEGENRYGRPPANWGSADRRSAGHEPTIWEAKLWEDEEPPAPVTTPAATSLKTPNVGSQFPSRPRPVFGRRPA